MCELTKRFRWGASVEAILEHFTTPQVDDLLAHCRKLIRECTDSEMVSEGYQITRFTFPMWEYVFLLAFSFEKQEWILEVERLPARLSSRARRANRRKKNDGNSARARHNLRSMRRMLRKCMKMYASFRSAWAGAGRKIGAFLCDGKLMSRAGRLINLVRELRPRRPRAVLAPTAILEMMRRFAETPHVSRVSRLVSAPLSDALAFLDEIFSFEPQSFEGPWDISWFGELPEPSERVR
jgi:hypothetical protein